MTKRERLWARLQGAMDESGRDVLYKGKLDWDLVREWIGDEMADTYSPGRREAAFLRMVAIVCNALCEGDLPTRAIRMGEHILLWCEDAEVIAAMKEAIPEGDLPISDGHYVISADWYYELRQAYLVTRGAILRVEKADD